MEFYAGGDNTDLLLAALQQRAQAEEQAAAVRAGTFDGLTQAIRDYAERRDAARRARENRQFASKEAEKGREHEAEQRGLDRSLSERQSREQRAVGTELDILQILGSMAGQAGAQGYPVPAFMDEILQRVESSPGIQDALGGGAARGGEARIPGVPGGFMQEDGGYQKLVGERGGQGSFSDIQPIPQPPSVEQQRLDRTKKMDAETMKAIADATQFALSPQGKKTLYIPTKMSRIEAMGWGNLDPDALDAEVVDSFPEVAPRPGMEGKEDRSRLDRKIKWLEEEIEVDVPNEAGFLLGRRFLARSVSNPDSLKAAMDAIAPVTGMRPARTMKDARQSAREFILNQMQEQKAAGRPAQLQGGGDLLSALQGQREAELAVGAPQPAVWSEDLVGQLGLNFDQLPRVLQNAARMGYPIEADESGRIVFRPRAEGTAAEVKVGRGTQEELDRLLANPAIRERLPAIMATGAAVKQTPSEVKDAATRRELQGKGATAEKEKEPPKKEEGARKAGPSLKERLREAPPAVPGGSAIERYRASKRQGGSPPKGDGPAAPRSSSRSSARTDTPPVPLDMSLVGVDLLRLLQGTGGLR